MVGSYTGLLNPLNEKGEHTMALPGETIGKGAPLVCPDCGSTVSDIKVCKSNMYYLGTMCPICGPYSRESDYFRNAAEAQAALESGNWIPR